MLIQVDDSTVLIGKNLKLIAAINNKRLSNPIITSAVKNEKSCLFGLCYFNSFVHDEKYSVFSSQRSALCIEI